MKFCGGCQIEKPLSEFNRRAKGHQAWCRECQHLSYEARYASPEERARLLESNQRRRNEIRDFVQGLKAAPCTDCGARYSYYVMQFDHIGSDKLFNIATAVTLMPSKERLLAELAKCELVCANCHMERTHNRSIPVAQLAEHRALDSTVSGSNPDRDARPL